MQVTTGSQGTCTSMVDNLKLCFPHRFGTQGLEIHAEKNQGRWLCFGGQFPTPSALLLGHHFMTQFVQVHDARIPFSGRNLTFRDVVGGARPHILILNKADLIPESDQEAIRKESMRQSPHISRVLFTDCKSFYCPQTAAIIPTVSKLVGGEDRSLSSIWI